MAHNNLASLEINRWKEKKMINMLYFEALSIRVAHVLGCEAVSKMSKPQQAALNQALDRMLEKHRTHETVTEDEIVGAYEMVVHHVLPNL